jgi:phospholipid/cholesterol/gamma-HCH transport system substrate-binding protein
MATNELIMKQNIIEVAVGFIVIIVAITFLAFAYNRDGGEVDEGYTLQARFQNAEGIVTGSDIMLAGIKIGDVKKLTLDRESFFAIMQMNIRKDVRLPKDSQAAIVSSGFLGGKFVSIVPGGDTEDFKDGDQIKFTQSSVNMESLIGKFMYSFGNNSSTSNNK